MRYILRYIPLFEVHDHYVNWILLQMSSDIIIAQYSSEIRYFPLPVRFWRQKTPTGPLWKGHVFFDFRTFECSISAFFGQEEKWEEETSLQRCLTCIYENEITSRRNQKKQGSLSRSEKCIRSTANWSLSMQRKSKQFLTD